MAKFPEGRIKLNHEDLWKLMERSKKRLAPKDGWVSLGFTMVQTNSISPSSCSSAPYAVLVMIGERKQERLGTWSDLHSMQRLCGSVAKTLLLLHVTPEADNTEIKFPFCLDIYHAEAVEVERWIPEKHREDVVLPSKTSKCWK